MPCFLNSSPANLIAGNLVSRFHCIWSFGSLWKDGALKFTGSTLRKRTLQLEKLSLLEKLLLLLLEVMLEKLPVLAILPVLVQRFSSSRERLPYFDFCNCCVAAWICRCVSKAKSPQRRSIAATTRQPNWLSARETKFSGSRSSTRAMER